MSTELEPLEADVLSLLRAAKPIADLEPAAKAAILASVEAQLVLPPPPGGGGGGAGGASGAGAGGSALTGATLTGARAIAAIAATFAIGVATGVVVAPSVSPPPITPATMLAPQAASAARSEPPPAPRASSEPPLPAVSVGSLPSAITTAKVARTETPEAPAPSARGLGAERSLLDIARGALARGEGAEALAAVDRHGREYPDGALVEEREALAVKALVALGRRDEARARAQRFEQRFPNGLMLRAVKGAIGEP